MSDSEHSMITRSKKKQLDPSPPGDTDGNDEMDEQGVDNDSKR